MEGLLSGGVERPPLFREVPPPLKRLEPLSLGGEAVGPCAVEVGLCLGPIGTGKETVGPMLSLKFGLRKQQPHREKHEGYLPPGAVWFRFAAHRDLGVA